MPDCNGRPTRSTWLVAVWLADNKPIYRQDLLLTVWNKLRSRPRASLSARCEVAARVERDVLANHERIVLPEPANLGAVAWEAIADHWLQRFGDFEPGY